MYILRWPKFCSLSLDGLLAYDGHFLFDNIGDSYIDNKVPYVGLRCLPALLGSLTVPVVFCTMRDSGYGLVACIVATSMVLFGIPPFVSG